MLYIAGEYLRTGLDNVRRPVINLALKLFMQINIY